MGAERDGNASENERIQCDCKSNENAPWPDAAKLDRRVRCADCRLLALMTRRMHAQFVPYLASDSCGGGDGGRRATKTFARLAAAIACAKESDDNNLQHFSPTRLDSTRADTMKSACVCENNIISVSRLVLYLSLALSLRARARLR